MRDWEELHRRVEHVANAIHLWIGVVLLSFVATLMLASKTDHPTGNLFLDMLLWGAALGLCAKLLIFAAKRLRARQFGDAPPRSPPDRHDLLGYAVAGLAGPLLLIWFVPRLAELHPETWQELSAALRARWVDGLLVAVGVGLIALPVYAFIRYVTRR
jgi:hypothetical protein